MLGKYPESPGFQPGGVLSWRTVLELVLLLVDVVLKNGLISAPMGALHATNSHNPLYSDLPYPSCCQLNASLGPGIGRTVHVLQGEHQGVTSKTE